MRFGGGSGSPTLDIQLGGIVGPLSAPLQGGVCKAFYYCCQKNTTSVMEKQWNNGALPRKNKMPDTHMHETQFAVSRYKNIV